MRVKFSVKFEKLKNIIHEILEYGKPEVKDGKPFFRGAEERNIVTPCRLCHIIFYTKETEYYDAVCYRRRCRWQNGQSKSNDIICGQPTVDFCENLQ